MAVAESLENFRTEVRDWLTDNFDPALKGRHNPLGMVDGPTDMSPDMVAWRKALGERGFGTPSWPKEYGGAGLSPKEVAILDEEMRNVGAYNPIGGLAIGMFAPTLMEYGTEEQKLKWLPPLSDGSMRGCQGYSEPGAGSDLANVQSFAEDKGDHYLINGQKTWQSGGQWADFCFGLFRTDKAHKHDGITFILVDMNSPGVERRPIKMISGASPFCETFFTDVKVPKENRVGEEGKGWTIGKRLLQFERAGIGGGGARGMLRSLADHAKQYVELNDNGEIVDQVLRQKIIKHEMAVRNFMGTVGRARREARAQGGPSATSSVLKNVGAKLAQERSDLMVEAMGMQGLGWEGEGFDANELKATRTWLWNRAVTIYGGSTEIQNNIISKRVLGMLDHQ
ncbi:acyl-CoA dehydrogenase family protein [Parasphingopyxis lamellibrachiae]|uniref:Alkylation response protein AidB-like acyl-CoA dehydrogenase n=1 Tax=Parasphingopyxis lamellibrachiae TaxID=680125 RepID=A0A3D9FF67_9SPHN|nr:acyl-CoA dehydrogenase family protein [Parasphingopyxis lamellibrachiae]RED16202.1 alkylation response protein AidB-like acyl-CoA dehydrogenase [Parasphingopyxis lamellibrachiae]